MIRVGDVTKTTGYKAYPYMITVLEIHPCGTKARCLWTDSDGCAYKDYDLETLRHTSAKEIFEDVISFYHIEEPSGIEFYSQKFIDWLRTKSKEYEDFRDKTMEECDEKGIDITDLDSNDLWDFDQAAEKSGWLLEIADMIDEEIDISEDFYAECVLKEKFEETDACLITEDMSSSEIFANLSDTQKDDIYRMVWSDHVVEDVRSYIEENMLPMDSDIIQEVAEEVANRYVYNGDYDCNMSYWSNIENLICEEISEFNERIFQFLYVSSETEDGVGVITCKITGSTRDIAVAAWLWQAAIGFSNAVFRNEDTMTLLKEDFNEREIDYLYEVFPYEISCDPITAYYVVIEKYREMGLTVEYIEYTDDVDVVSSHGVY